jgi:hypothetical protein
MSRKAILSLLFSIITWAGFSSSAQCEIVDRIVAVINGRIITLSDIRKEHRLQLAMNGPTETDGAVLNDLIDRYLLEEEMSQYPGLDVSDDEIDKGMKNVTDTHGLALSEIRNAYIHNIQRQKYFYLRFGQFIAVSNEEIETYYNKVYVPEAKRRGETPEDLNKVAQVIRQNVYFEKLSQQKELEDFLKELRTRSTTTIEIID